MKYWGVRHVRWLCWWMVAVHHAQEFGNGVMHESDKFVLDEIWYGKR